GNCTHTANQHEPKCNRTNKVIVMRVLIFAMAVCSASSNARGTVQIGDPGNPYANPGSGPSAQTAGRPTMFVDLNDAWGYLQARTLRGNVTLTLQCASSFRWFTQILRGISMHWIHIQGSKDPEVPCEIIFPFQVAGLQVKFIIL